MTNQKQTATYFIPTREEVLSLSVGDLALGVFGWGQVTRIFDEGNDFRKKAFKCFYVKTKKGLHVSCIYKEDELCRTMEVTGLHNSYEVDRIEKDMLMNNTRLVTGVYIVKEIQFHAREERGDGC